MKTEMYLCNLQKPAECGQQIVLNNCPMVICNSSRVSSELKKNITTMPVCPYRTILTISINDSINDEIQK
jgi:hypothetical protein